MVFKVFFQDVTDILDGLYIIKGKTKDDDLIIKELRKKAKFLHDFFKQFN